MDWLETVMDRTDPRRAPLPTTEFIFNSARDQISHLVVELTFSDMDGSQTVCGIEATSADLFPNYNLCADCTGEESVP